MTRDAPGGRPNLGTSWRILPYSLNEEKKETLMIEGLFQPMHLLVIFGIALLVFGPKKLPELGKGIGDGIRGFKTAMKQIDEGSENGTKP